MNNVYVLKEYWTENGVRMNRIVGIYKTDEAAHAAAENFDNFEFSIDEEEVKE